MLKDKLKASGIHFFFSALVIFCFVALVYFIWFTPTFFIEMGALTPLKVLVLVDVVLGPLLTFIVYKEGKKSLKMDLSIIILVQIIALGYGAYSTYLGRPVLVFLDDKSYKTIIQKQLEDTPIEQPELQTNVFSKPVLSIIPDDQLQPFAPPSKKAVTIVPMTDDFRATVEGREVRDWTDIARITNLDETVVREKINAIGYDFDQVYSHMLYVNDIFHILISDKNNFQPLIIITDPSLKEVAEQ